jgi:hypothetical protein
LALKSAGGLWITLPAVKRVQGLATGGTGVGELLVVVVVCAKALACHDVSTTRQDNTNGFTFRVFLLFMILL